MRRRWCRSNSSTVGRRTERRRGNAAEARRPRGRARGASTGRGSNTKERTLPGSRRSRGPGRSKGNSRPRSPGSPAACGHRSTGPDAPTPESTPTGQVIAFTYAGRLSGAELERALDALLPPDVAIRDVRRVPLGWHPRRAARYREYRYTVWNGPRSPLRQRQALVGAGPARQRRDGARRVGPRGPARLQRLRGGDRSRSGPCHAVRVRRTGPLVTIDVRADAFLRGMVRRIVAVLLEVGRGTMDEARGRGGLAGRAPALNGASPRRRVCAFGGSSSVGAGGRPGLKNTVCLGSGWSARATMTAKTYSPAGSEIERRWFVVDATDETLGRLASRIARVLEGKHKPTYAPPPRFGRPRDRPERRRASP